MQYKVSKDYKRLKQLLDKGNSVVCFVDFSHGGEYITDIAYAKRKGKGKYEHYNIYYNGRLHVTIYTTWCSGFVDEKIYKMFEGGNVQFIDPDYERNTLELECKR